MAAIFHKEHWECQEMKQKSYNVPKWLFRYVTINPDLFMSLKRCVEYSTCQENG